VPTFRLAAAHDTEHLASLRAWQRGTRGSGDGPEGVVDFSVADFSVGAESFEKASAGLKPLNPPAKASWWWKVVNSGGKWWRGGAGLPQMPAIVCVFQTSIYSALCQRLRLYLPLLFVPIFLSPLPPSIQSRWA